MAEDLNLAGPGKDVLARLAAAQRRAPVVWSEGHRAWVALSHQAVSEGFRLDWLSSDRSGVFERVARSRPPAFRQVVDLLAGWMVFRDPPAHTRLREPVRSAFTPRRMHTLENAISPLVDELLDNLAETGGGDLREALARPLPALVIGELLGVPATDRRLLQDWSDELAGVVFAASSAQMDVDRAMRGAGGLTGYFSELVAYYLAHPADNLVSAIARAGQDGMSHLPPGEVVGACALLLFAGHETTAGFLANAVWTLFENPDDLARWRSSPELDETAIEELMRLAGPASVMVRRATRSERWHGADLHEGDAVYLCMAAANRDPTIFADPGRLILDRHPNPHLGFGWGLHYCLGAPLARIESRIALRRLLDRFPGLRPAGEPRWVSGVLGRSSGPVPVEV